MKMKQAMQCATAVSLALVLSTAYAADTQTSEPMTGKQKATAIGAGTGAVAGAVVGGPVGAVIGAGIGGVVGHEGTDANGKVKDESSSKMSSASRPADNTVRNAQVALNDQGYSVGAADGQWGPARKAQCVASRPSAAWRRAARSTTPTLSALGVNP